MEKMIQIMSIICFLNSCWWLIADVTGKLVFKFIVKVLGIVGTVLPIIYWLKILGMI
jgi:hypothetical protein